VLPQPETLHNSRSAADRAAVSAPAEADCSIGERRPGIGREGARSAIRSVLARAGAGRLRWGTARPGRVAVAFGGLVAVFAASLILSRTQPDQEATAWPAGAHSGSAGRSSPAKTATEDGSRAAATGGAAAVPAGPAGFSSQGPFSLAAGPETTGGGTGPATGFVARLQAAQSAPPRGISGVVRLAPEFAGRVAPGDILFIYAREPGGAGAPVAFIRKRARQLPLAFFLDDSTSINPARPLSGHDRLVIGARVSRNGDAAASAGDLQGSLEAQYGAAGVVIVIDSEVR